MPAEGETFRLLQPGLMSVDELKELLSQRGVSIKSSESETKYQLVELYERLMMPLSQRKFPNSHQGKIISSKIAEEERKRARNEPKSSRDFKYGFEGKPSESSKRHINHQSSSNSGSDRLKPPVDSCPLPPKKICLARRTSDRDLDKIIINDRSKRSSGSSSEESGKEHSLKAEERRADKKSPTKSHSSTPKDSSKEKDKDEPNPKRKKIAWP